MPLDPAAVDAALAAYAEDCTRQLADAEDGWPERLVLRGPVGPVEAQAFMMFCAMLERATGRPVRVSLL